MSKQYSTVTTKLDYKRMARTYSLESLKLQRQLETANEEIKRLTRIVQEKEKFPYMESAK